MVAKSRKFAICRKIAACAPSCSSCMLSSGPFRCRVVPYAPGSQRRHRDGRWRSDGGGLRWPQSRDFDDIAQVSGSRRGIVMFVGLSLRLDCSTDSLECIWTWLDGRGIFFRIWRNPRRLISDYVYRFAVPQRTLD